MTHMYCIGVNQPLHQSLLHRQGCILLRRAPPNISQRAGRGALPSARTMDRLAGHSAGTEYRRSRQHCDGRQLVQRLSSLPSKECPIVLYLTNAGQAFVFPYQAVRIPFDEMRRHRVTNLPRRCRWSASENQNVPQGARKHEPRGHRVSTQPCFHSDRSGKAVPEWRVLRTANQLKSNQPQSPRRRETAELFSQSPKHKHSHLREVQQVLLLPQNISVSNK